MSTEVEILRRVCDLEVGNIFLLMNTQYRVTKKEFGRIYYRAVFYDASGTKNSFGEKCQMKVKLIKGNE